MRSYYGFKKDQTQVFSQTGSRLGITKLLVKPLVVVGLRRKDKDGYEAIRVGVGEKKKLAKALSQGLKKANVKIKPRFIRELKVEDAGKYELGKSVAISEVLGVGDKVKVQGVTKGKGFTGVMKRWGFKGGPRTHGQSDRDRAPGSIGQGTDPGRVWKGKKMAGRHGGKPHTVVGLKVVKVDEANQELWVTGFVPGAKGGLIKITKTGKGKEIKLGSESDKETKEKKIAQPAKKSRERQSGKPVEKKAPKDVQTTTKSKQQE